MRRIAAGRSFLQCARQEYGERTDAMPRWRRRLPTRSLSGTELLEADLLAGAGGEAVREMRELAARPPDRPLRDSATALVGEIEGLFDEVIVVRTELLERAEPEPEDDRAGLRERPTAAASIPSCPASCCSGPRRCTGNGGGRTPSSRGRRPPIGCNLAPIAAEGSSGEPPFCCGPTKFDTGTVMWYSRS